MAFLVGMAARALAGQVAKKAAVDLVAKQVLKQAATGAVRGMAKQAAGTAVKTGLKGGLNSAMEYGVQATRATAQGAVKTTARASMQATAKTIAGDMKSAALTGRQMMTGGNQIAGKRMVQAARWGNRMMGGDGMTNQERGDPGPFGGGAPATGGGYAPSGGNAGAPGPTPRGAGFGRTLRTMAEGGARGQSLLNGTNFSPTRGFTTVAVPTRTQAQASTWGQTGQMGKTAYSGFGQLELNRGFRGVSHTPGYSQMRGDDHPEGVSEVSGVPGAYAGAAIARPLARSEHFVSGAGTVAATAQPVFHSTIKEEMAARASTLSTNIQMPGRANQPWDALLDQGSDPRADPLTTTSPLKKRK